MWAADLTVILNIYAAVVELVYTQVSKTCASKGLRARIPPAVPELNTPLLSGKCPSFSDRKKQKS